MIKPKTIKVGDSNFHLNPLPVLKAIRLDKKVVTVLLPALSGLQGLSPESSIDLEALSKGISEALGRLPDDEFNALFVDLLASAVYIPSNGAPVELTSPEQLDSVFGGNLVDLYKLIFEIMRYNKFSPFVLLEGVGNLMKKISISKEPDMTNSKNGNQSGKSDN